MPRKGENITKRKDGRWEARTLIGHDDNGKPRYKYYYAKTYREVKAKRENDKREATCSNKSNGILLTDAVDAYLRQKRFSVKEATYARYYELAQKHICVPFGSIPLSEIDRAFIQRFIIQKYENGRLDGKGGLSSKTVRDLFSFFRSVLIFASCNGWYHVNLSNFSLPKLQYEDVQILTKSHQKSLENWVLNHLSSQTFGVLLSLYTGIRIGELCALKWSDIDLKNNILSVSRTLLRINNLTSDSEMKTKILIDTAKTKASIRKIPLPNIIAGYLRNMSGQVTANCYFLTGTEYFIEPNLYYNMYKTWLKECNVPHYTFHALRHTFATNCIEKGVDPKTLSELLGHANVNITLNRYVHPSMDLKRAQIERLAADF